MLRFLKKAALLIVGSLLFIGGGFVAIAGAVSGFGISSLSIKIMFVIAGICLVTIGLYCYYLGSNKNLLKVVSDIIDLIVLNS